MSRSDPRVNAVDILGVTAILILQSLTGFTCAISTNFTPR